MKKLSLRELARVYLGRDRLGCQLARRALEQTQMDGWVVSHVPKANDFDRELVLVRDGHPMAQLLLAAQRERTVVSRESVEQLAGDVMDWDEGGIYLGRHGLAVMRLMDDSVEVQGTSADLACYVNLSRYRTPRVGISAKKVTAAAIGRRYQLRRLHDTTRLQAALIFEDFDVDASDLLDSRRRIRLRSKWMIPNGQEVARG